MTSTSNFGVSRREGHDSSGFYSRFSAPVVVADETIEECEVKNQLICGDARDMADVADNSVALVVTSPPYFAGKAYEEEVGVGHVPASYLAYLEMLRDVFAECWRVLEPGGRIAVNVANLGRKPYRSLSGDVTRILEFDLGFLLRAEIIWQKGQGASGSCAWGSFASAGNPVVRDLTERIIVASKGRFDRAVKRKDREKRGLPYVNTISNEEFMESTLDVWHMGTESAKRVGHPAPYPIELPRRLINLYTYQGDVVLDPFIGSGSTAMAALEMHRYYVGYDIDPDYLKLAENRIASMAEPAKKPAVRKPAAKKVTTKSAPAPKAKAAKTAPMKKAAAKSPAKAVANKTVKPVAKAAATTAKVATKKATRAVSKPAAKKAPARKPAASRRSR